MKPVKLFDKIVAIAAIVLATLLIAGNLIMDFTGNYIPGLMLLTTAAMMVTFIIMNARSEEPKIYLYIIFGLLLLASAVGGILEITHVIA